MRAVALFIGITMFSLAPSAAGQATVPNPYPGCEARPLECDPVVANGGKVKRDDEPVTLILYAHVRNHMERAPLNAQPPHPEHEPDIDQGDFLPTFYTADERLPCCKVRNNPLVMAGAAGLVEYMPDGNWRFYEGPAIGKDTEIASSHVTGFVYLSPRISWPMETPGLMPAVGVHMRAVMGHGYGAPQDITIAEGDTGTGYLEEVPDPNGGVILVSLPGEDPVYEFRVPMVLRLVELPASEDWVGQPWGTFLTIVAVPYQFEGEHGGFTQHWSWRTGHRFPPRIVMDVLRPLETAGIELGRYSDGLTARWEVNMTLGKYDVAPETFRVAIHGPSSIEPEPFGFSIGYDALGPVTVTRRIPTERALDGTYTISASFLNYQRTYEVSSSATFEVRSGRAILASDAPMEERAELPGFHAGFVFSAVAIVLWTRCRRR